MIDPVKRGDDRVFLQGLHRQFQVGVGDFAVFLGLVNLSLGDLELALGLGDVFGGDHARLPIIEPLVAGHDRNGNLFLCFRLLGGSRALGLQLVLPDGQLGHLVMQDADRAAFLDRHADLELHVLDHTFAQGRPRPTARSSRSALARTARWTGRPLRRTGRPPLWASAATLINNASRGHGRDRF